MNAFSARSASALLRPACSAMLSTSSDLFTLCLRICACSQEVERIYGKRSSISASRVVTHRFDMHTRDRRKCRVRCSPNMFRPLHTRFHAQETVAERTTFLNASGGYRAHISQDRHRECARASLAKSKNRAFARPRRTLSTCPRRDLVALSTRPRAARRTRTSPATRAGLSCSPEQIRTAVTALRGRRPRPLDDGAVLCVELGGEDSNPQ